MAVELSMVLIVKGLLLELTFLRPLIISDA